MQKILVTKAQKFFMYKFLFIIAFKNIMKIKIIIRHFIKFVDKHPIAVILPYKFQHTYSDPMVPFSVFRLFVFEI